MPQGELRLFFRWGWRAKCSLIVLACALAQRARGYHRTLRVARTLADLDGEEKVARIHVAEALSYRGETLRRAQEAA